MITENILANAGTPLMWAGFIHLIIGNLFIGILEGLLLGFIFRLSKWKSILWMIAANYVSSWAGMIIIGFAKHNFEDITIYQVTSYLWTALFIAYLVTLLLEWPFIWMAMKDKTGPWKKSIFATLIVQTVSYALLAGCWYYPASGISLLRDTILVPTTNFTQNKNAVVYFVNSSDGDVYKICLDGSSLTKIETLNLKTEWAAMSLVENPQNDTLDLVCYSESRDRDKEKIIIFESLIPENLAHLYFQSEPQWQSYQYETVDLRHPQNRQWRAYTRFWPIEGLTLENESTKESIHLAMETPFLAWYARQATILPNDEVVFEVGGQICLFDRQSRKLALLAKGYGPVVLLEDSMNNQKSESQSSDSTQAPKGSP
ncbi:MAG: hypothetical protein FJ263_00835 [Planctomycetes bacterium]|nr:hypothetical protein [Planctomycetota bacterium]